MLWVRAPNESTPTWNLPTIWFIKAHVLHLVHILFINPVIFCFEHWCHLAHCDQKWRVYVSRDQATSASKLKRCEEQKHVWVEQPSDFHLWRVSKSRSITDLKAPVLWREWNLRTRQYFKNVLKCIFLKQNGSDTSNIFIRPFIVC